MRPPPGSRPAPVAKRPRAGKTRVLIADDHPVFCDGMKSLLGEQRDMKCVGCARDGEEAVRLAQKFRPDVAVLDLAMPRMDGLAAMERLRLLRPDTAVLILSGWMDHDRIAAVLRAGAMGYVYRYVGNNPSKLRDPLGVDAYIGVRPLPSGRIEVNIIIPINYSGDGLSPDVIIRFNQGIQGNWSGNFGKYDVQTVVTGPSNPYPFTDRFRNQINVTKDKVRSSCEGHRYGTWDSTDSGWDAAHEAGHLLGLEDGYDEDTNLPLEGRDNDIMGAREKRPNERLIEEVLKNKSGANRVVPWDNFSSGLKVFFPGRR